MRVVIVATFVAACGSSNPSPIANQVSTTESPRPIDAPTRGFEVRVVDADAPFMRLMFVHVGMEKDGKPTDALALSSGVSVDLDAWSADIDPGKLYRDIYLKARQRATIEKYLAELASKDPRFVMPSDREIGFEKVKDGWRTYYLEKPAPIDGSMIKDATTARDPNTEEPIVWIVLDVEGTRRFAELTKRIAGRKLAIILDGEIRMAPIINGEISGGRASLRMGAGDPDQQQQEATRIAKKLMQK
jgi:hypothetical protein